MDLNITVGLESRVQGLKYYILGLTLYSFSPDKLWDCLFWLSPRIWCATLFCFCVIYQRSYAYILLGQKCLLITILFYKVNYIIISTASSEERTRRQPVVNRPQQPAAVNKTCWLASTDIKCDPNSAYRTIDGSCNNLKHPTWGQSIRPMARLLSPLYEPGN